MCFNRQDTRVAKNVEKPRINTDKHGWKPAAWLLFYMLFVFADLAVAEMLGTRGAVYPIAERSFIEEVKERAAAVKPPTEEEIKKGINAKAGELMIRLPRAQKDDLRRVDISWTTDKEYLLTKKGFVYPAGYKFNPAEFATYPLTIVVFDAGDEKQREWFWQNYGHNHMVKTLISGGNLLETEYWLARKLEEERVKKGEPAGNLTSPPIWPLPKKLAERFQLRTVPCEIKQEGILLAVREFANLEEKR
jgi:conjugal transfer pilus assembly protein TraW